MFDPSDDFAAVIDGFESVTLLRQGETPAGAAEAIAHALRRATASGEAAIVTSTDVHRFVPSGGQQTAVDVVWHLPVAELPRAPQLGDVIVDGQGQRWTILEVKHLVLSARWRCGARNVAVAFGLDDTISVLKAVYVKGTCGAAEPIWRTWQTGIRARIQPTETKYLATADAHATKTQYRIFVEGRVQLDHTCRIVGPEGTLYTITGTSGMDRIGELQVIDVEVTR